VILSGKFCTIVFSPEDELSVLIQNIDTNLRDYNHIICLDCPQNFNSRAFGRKLKLRVLTPFSKMRFPMWSCGSWHRLVWKEGKNISGEHVVCTSNFPSNRWH